MPTDALGDGRTTRLTRPEATGTIPSAGPAGAREMVFMDTPVELVVFYPSPPNAVDTPP